MALLGETKAYSKYSEDELAKQERGTRDGLLFAVFIPDRNLNVDRSSLQGEYLAGIGKKAVQFELPKL